MMLRKEIFGTIRDALPHAEVLQNEPMRLHTSMKAGGPAAVYAAVHSVWDMVRAVSLCRSLGVPFFLLGNASNVLFRDGGFDGVVIQWTDDASAPLRFGDTLLVSAGMMLSRVASYAWRESLSGMECLSGIPGTVGGGAAINAGAYGGEMKDVVRRVQVLDPCGRIFWVNGSDMDFRYRHSRAMDEGWIILAVEFALLPADPRSIREKMDELARKRREKQPLELPSCGSTFKRPEGYFAAALIEEAGLKGCSVGNAQVSPKHAGFVVNNGNATAGDILELVRKVREGVRAYAGVTLELEMMVVGDDLHPSCGG